MRDLVLSILQSGNFWGLLAGVPLAVVSSIYIVSRQRTSYRQTIEENTARFVFLAIESVGRSIGYFHDQMRSSGTVYFDLADLVVADVEKYNSVKHDIFLRSDFNLVKRVDEFFWKVKLYTLRAKSMQNAVYQADLDEKIPLPERPARKAELQQVARGYVDDLLTLASEGRALAAEIEKEIPR